LQGQLLLIAVRPGAKQIAQNFVASQIGNRQNRALNTDLNVFGENRLDSRDNASIPEAALQAAAVGTVTGILNSPKL
jgi:hypothetical protein